MNAKLKLFPIAVVLWAFAGCREEDLVLAAAKKDFVKQRPGIEIVDSGIRRRDADQVVVYVRFVNTPASAFPPEAGIWEDEMVYVTKDGKWQCVSVKGGNYIRAARWPRL